MTPTHRVHFCSKIALDQIKEIEEHETNIQDNPAAGEHWDSIRRITIRFLSHLLETDTMHLCLKDSSRSGI